MIKPIDLIPEWRPVRSERYIGETGMWEITVTPPAMAGFDCVSTVFLTEEQHRRYCKWLETGGLQNLLPELSDDVREQLMSGITPEAWAQAFPPDDDDA